MLPYTHFQRLNIESFHINLTLLKMISSWVKMFERSIFCYTVQRWTDTDTSSDMSSCTSPCPKQTRTRTQDFLGVRTRTRTKSWLRIRTLLQARACSKILDMDSDTDILRTRVSTHLWYGMTYTKFDIVIRLNTSIHFKLSYWYFTN